MMNLTLLPSGSGYGPAYAVNSGQQSLAGLVPGHGYILPENALAIPANRGLGSIFLGTGFVQSDAIVLAGAAAMLMLLAPSPKAAVRHVRQTASDNTRGILALVLAAGLYFGGSALSNLGKPAPGVIE